MKKQKSKKSAGRQKTDWQRTFKIPIKICRAAEISRPENIFGALFGNFLRRAAALSLILTLNWAGLAAVGQTFGYFSDTESSSGIFVAGTLDFVLDSPLDFPSVCSTEGKPAERIVSIINNGNPFKYVASSTDLTGDVCDYVNLEANLDGGEPEYVGPLKDFNSGVFEFSEPETWNFKLLFSSALPPELAGQTCTFKFVFDGSQTKNDLPFGEGFSDTEEITSNITAPDCQSYETKSMGYWKTHSEIYAGLLPQSLGDEIISTPAGANQVFKRYSDSMRNKLRGQLLAMKFNIAYLGIGGYLVESEDQTLSQIVEEADELLRQQPPPADSELAAMKNLLEYWNVDQQLTICFCEQNELGESKIESNIVDVVINEFLPDSVGHDDEFNIDGSLAMLGVDSEAEQIIETASSTEEVVGLSEALPADENASSSEAALPAQGEDEIIEDGDASSEETTGVEENVALNVETQEELEQAEEVKAEESTDAGQVDTGGGQPADNQNQTTIEQAPAIQQEPVDTASGGIDGSVSSGGDGGGSGSDNSSGNSVDSAGPASE